MVVVMMTVTTLLMATDAILAMVEEVHMLQAASEEVFIRMIRDMEDIVIITIMEARRQAIADTEAVEWMARMEIIKMIDMRAIEDKRMIGDQGTVMRGEMIMIIGEEQMITERIL